MKNNDRDLFLLSMASGLLGALAFILGKSIEQAQADAKRHMEDARTRFENSQYNSDEGGNVQR